MANRTYAQYKSLLAALRRSKFTSPGVLAGLLLEAFIERGGRIYAADVVEKGLCTDGQFRSWRSHMVETGWLTYDTSKVTNMQYSIHSTGPKLTAYVAREFEQLNRKKLQKAEVATKEDLHGLEERFESKYVTRTEFEAMKEIMLAYYEEHKLGPLDPPDYTVGRSHRQTKLKSVKKTSGDSTLF